MPSAIARSLITNRTWTIGMVLPSVVDPFMGRIVEGVEQVAVEADLTVFLSTSHSNLERELAIIKELEQRRVDAIIIYASDLNAPYADYVRDVTDAVRATGASVAAALAFIGARVTLT